MPWTVADVDRHKKGLTTAQKKKWVSVANGVLKDCQSKGGKDCEGKAIRIANSKFSEEGGEVERMERIPKLALTFANPTEGSVMLAEEEGKKPRLQMLAYSGGIIKGHWWWGDLAIDLTGMSFPDSKYPVLEEHDRHKKIAFTKKPRVDDFKLLVEDGTFVDTEASNEFQRLSKEGFPYQASIHATPTILEKVGEGESSKVNGFTFKGPGTIWRKSVFREVSVCVFGWDKNTKSEALGDVELTYTELGLEEKTDIGKEVKEIMTLEELKEKDPEGYKALMKEASEMAEASVEEKLAGENTELRDQLANVSKALEESNGKLKDLEKKEAIRAERERLTTNEMKAAEIWRNQLDESDLTDIAKKKLPEHVDPKKFMKDDGYLDEEAFAEAVTTEIKFWTEEVGVTNTVLGTGMSRRAVDQESQVKKKQEEDDDKWVEEMMSLTRSMPAAQTT